jgi:hypothetical protein
MNKHLLALATGLLLGTTAATAQLHNWDNLPTLEEWPLEPYMRNVRAFYALPNFELPEGKNAVVVVKPDGKWATWYLRHPGDSVNQFDWNHPESAIGVDAIDLNNDGVMDYLSGSNLYMGTEYGSKPSREPQSLIGSGFFYGNSVLDVNGDGYPDMVRDERILLGGSMPSMYKRVEVPFDSVRIRNYFNTKIRYFSSWEGSDGVIRYAISYTDSVLKEPVRQSLCIYRMQVTGEAVRLELEHEIESVGFNHLVSGVSPFQPEGTNGREFVFMQRGDNANRTELYAIENGKWVLKGQLGRGLWDRLGGSIDGDNVTDWVFRDFERGKIIAYSGKFLPNLVPLCYMPEYSSSYAVLGDINNDGFNDIACMIEGQPRQFSVALGRDLATSVPENQNGKLSMHLYPNPADSRISLHASLQRSGKYSILLYSIAGERVAELRSGMYAEGELMEQFDLRPLGLAPGAYVLRLTGNGTFTDMQFIYGGN